MFYRGGGFFWSSRKQTEESPEIWVLGSKKQHSSKFTPGSAGSEAPMTALINQPGNTVKLPWQGTQRMVELKTKCWKRDRTFSNSCPSFLQLCYLGLSTCCYSRLCQLQYSPNNKNLLLTFPSYREERAAGHRELRNQTIQQQGRSFYFAGVFVVLIGDSL